MKTKQEISPATTLYCLIGDPVSHSRSPAMMNAAFEELGMDAVYLAFHVPEREVGAVLNALRIINVGGINVTAPHKGRVIGYIDELFPEAQLTASVNTILPSRDKLIGHNTDGSGLISAIKDELKVAVAGSRILIIGAGGAA
ncbi:MAG: shikimate dehydrogenase, partial [Deltaproteobacteria bacterium]